MNNIYQKIVSTVRYRILSLEEEVDIIDEETLLISHVPGTTEIDQKKLILLRNVKSVLHDTLLTYYIHFSSLCPSTTTSISEATKFHIQVLKLREMEILIGELFGQQSALNTFVGKDYYKYSRDFCVPDDMKLRLLAQVFPFEFEFDLLSDPSFFEFLLRIVNEYKVDNHEELIKMLFERISIQKPKSVIYFFTADSPLYFCLAEHFLSSFVHNQMFRFEWDPLENFSIYQKCRLIASQGPLSCSIKPSLINLLKSAQGNDKILEIIKNSHKSNAHSSCSFYFRPFNSRFNAKMWNLYNNKKDKNANFDFNSMDEKSIHGFDDTSIYEYNKYHKSITKSNNDDNRNNNNNSTNNADNNENNNNNNTNNTDNNENNNSNNTNHKDDNRNNNTNNTDKNNNDNTNNTDNNNNDNTNYNENNNNNNTNNNNNNDNTNYNENNSTNNTDNNNNNNTNYNENNSTNNTDNNNNNNTNDENINSIDSNSKNNDNFLKKKSSSKSYIYSKIEEEVVKIRREKESLEIELPQLWHVSLDLKRLSLQTSPSFVLCVLANSLRWLTNAITTDGNFVGGEEILEFFVFSLALSGPKNLPALCSFTERFLDGGLKDETKFSYLLTQLSGALTFIQQRLLRVPPFLIFPFKKPIERLRGRMRRVESDIVMRGFRIYAIPTFRREKDELFPAFLQYTGNEDDVAICSAFSFSVDSNEEEDNDDDKLTTSSSKKVQVFPLNMPYFEVIPTIYGSFLQLTDEYVNRLQMIRIDNGNIDDTIEAVNAISIAVKLLPKGNNFFDGNHVLKLGDLNACFEILNRKWESRISKNFARYHCQNTMDDNDEAPSKSKKKKNDNDDNIEKVDEIFGTNRKYVTDAEIVQKLKLLVAEMQKSIVLINNLSPSFIIDGILNSSTWSILKEMFNLNDNDIITTSIFDELVPK